MDRDKTGKQTTDKLRQRIDELEKEHSRIREQLRESQKSAQDIIDSSLDMIIAVDKERRIVEFNRTAQETFGYSREEVLGKHIDILYNDPTEGLEVNESVRRTGRFIGKVTNKRKSGESFPSFISASILHNTKGKPTGFMGISRDITQQKQMEEELREHRERLEALVRERTVELVETNEELRQEIAKRTRVEEALRESEEKYRALVENANEAILVAQDMIVKFANPKVLEVSGYPKEELISRPFVEFVHPDDREMVIKRYTERLKEEEFPHIYSFRIVAKDGNIKWVEINTVLINWEGKPATLSFLTDITDRKRAEEVLRESEERYRSIFEAVPDMIALVDEGGTIIDCNSQIRRLLNYTSDEIVGRYIEGIIHPDYIAKIHDSLKEGLTKGATRMKEFKMVRKDGRVIDASVKFSALRDEKGNYIRAVCVIEDITQKRKMEEELLKVQKLESVSVLAGGIAHDFNNILTVVLGNISLASMYADPDRISERLAEAEKAAIRARDLTQQLLTFSKGGAPVKEIASIAELLRDSTNFALRGSNVRCEFSIPDDLWLVEIDKSQMDQVINSLIVNADQATPDGGVVRICAENVTMTAEDALPLEAGKYVKISIEDGGVGISGEHLRNIFDPYFTTKDKGSGLGLAASYSITRNHGGHITVTSGVGFGTIFYIYLPALKATLVDRVEAEDKTFIGEGRILVMDDEEQIRNLASEVLSIIGYEVAVAADGDEAIELYREAKGSAHPFDAVILDLTIPGGMGGKEAIQRLTEMDPEVKGIVSSGYSNDPIMANFREYGFKGVITKPYRVKELSGILHKVLTQSLS